MVLRARKQEAVFLFVNSPTAHVRLRYIHMNPKRLDEDGIVSGKRFAEGETIGMVGNYNDYERGTTYHLHFDMQAPTELGYVFVNPYMTLVSAYERLIGARGTEIKDVSQTAAPRPQQRRVLRVQGERPRAGVRRRRRRQLPISVAR